MRMNFTEEREEAQRATANDVIYWLAANLGMRTVEPLRAEDRRALAAADQVLNLYAATRRPEILTALAICVRQMQPVFAWLAYHGIAHVLGWEEREVIWRESGLEADLPMPGNLRKCLFEPTDGISQKSAKDAEPKEAA